jgi:hypothetical protein
VRTHSDNACAFDTAHSYTPFVDGETPLSACMAIPHSLDSMILHAHHSGIGLDSSWRHKNENRAPMTLITVVNRHGHMMPGAGLLSSDVTRESLVVFLTKTAAQISKRARRWLSGRADAHGRLDEEVSELKRQSELIVQAGWRPKHAMIDKCRAEANALAEALPNVPIRLCQFHIVQAIIRWTADSGESASSAAARPAVTRQVQYHIVDAFRTLQRTRTLPNDGEDEVDEVQKAESFVAARRVFYGAIKHALEQCHDEKIDIKAAYIAIKDYFRTNWFDDFWRPMWIDDGLPLGETRDGTGSTNNWVERAFRTFDDVFLERRANKRIDTLAVIILEQFFPFYQYFEGVGRPSEQLVSTMDDAWDTWALGFVTETSPFDQTQWQVITRKQNVYQIDLRKPSCQHGELMCKVFRATGKRCAHMWAAVLQRNNGAHDRFNGKQCPYATVSVLISCEQQLTARRTKGCPPSIPTRIASCRIVGSPGCLTEYTAGVNRPRTTRGLKTMIRRQKTEVCLLRSPTRGQGASATLQTPLPRRLSGCKTPQKTTMASSRTPPTEQGDPRTLRPFTLAGRTPLRAHRWPKMPSI